MNPTTDDPTGATFIDAMVAEVEKCLAEGSGYARRFGLVAVDRKTFQRTLQPSARTLAAHAGAGRL